MKKWTEQAIGSSIRWLSLWQNACAFGVSILSMLLWSYFRSRYAGGCDSFAYLSRARSFLGLDSGFEMTMSPAEFPALVPLCHSLVNGEVISIFPPGYSAIMAVFGTVGLEFFCTAVLGAASVLLIYLATASVTGNRTLALAISIIWPLAPIVGWGSMRIMSDMPATVFVLLAYVLLTRKKEGLSGIVLGLSLFVRPTNLLVLPALAWVAREQGKTISFVLSFTAAASSLAIYNLVVFGGPLANPYGFNIHELGPGDLAAKFVFFGLTTSQMLWPLLLPVAYAVIVRFRASLPLLLWFLSFFLFFSAWEPSIDKWWGVRFLLPAYPAVFLLAGFGVGLAHERLAARWPSGMRYVNIVVAIAFVATVCNSVWFLYREKVYTTKIDETYYLDCLEMRELLPTDCLVGAVNYTGPIRLYSGMESFSWNHPGASELINQGIWDGRQVFLIADPDSGFNDAALRRIMSSYNTRKIARLSRYPLTLYQIGPGYKGINLSAYPEKAVTLDLGLPTAREHLVSGWSGDEIEGDSTWVWATGDRSVVSLQLEPVRSTLVRFSARPFVIPGEERQQTVAVLVNGERLKRFALKPGPEVYMFEIPARLVQDENKLAFEFGYAISPGKLGLSKDTRRLAVSFDWIELR